MFFLREIRVRHHLLPCAGGDLVLVVDVAAVLDFDLGVKVQRHSSVLSVSESMRLPFSS